MTMMAYPEDYLRQYVYDHVWCAPEQDRQRVFKVDRITPINGVAKNFHIGRKRYDMPSSSGRWHVYIIGQIFPELIGLIPRQREWFSMRYLCQHLDGVIDVYTEKGQLFPRSQAYYMVADDRTVTIAVKVPDRRLVDVDLNTEDVYFRIYRNAFYYRENSNTQGLKITCRSVQASSNADILTIQNEIDTFAGQPGAVLSYVNGQLVNKVSLLTAQAGDFIGFMHDPTIKLRLTFKADQLHEYVSELDGINKYLLHHQFGSDVVDYYDDIDVYVLNKPDTQNYLGRYYHKNTEQRLRNVTHRDYVIDSVGVAQMYDYFKTPINHAQAYVHLIIRDGASDRSLVHEANRIRDMYRMTDPDVYASLIGMDANVSVWNVADLEKSAYMKVMRAKFGTITKQDAFDALGYNAMSTLLGDTPSRMELVSGQKLITVPEGLKVLSMAYEYDANGRLLGWYPHTNNQTHVAQNPETDLVEMVYGEGTTHFDDVVGSSPSMLDRESNYRFYMSTLSNGTSLNDWEDVSGLGYYHVYESGQVQWAVGANKQPVVRSNKKHLCYQFTHPMEDGNLQFNVSYWDAVAQAWKILHIPPARIDIFLNGHNLIEGIDYVVKWPAIYVISKEYLVNPGVDPQSIVIRGMGFCNQDMTRIEPGDSGFVKHGVLSENNVYDIRDDKVNRIVVGGALYRWDELEYAETDGTVRITDPLNGKPYMVTDILVPMNNFSEAVISDVDPTLSVRAAARVIDKEISDYLTQKLPERDLNPPSTFVAKYRLFSPFFTKLFSALQTGLITGDWLQYHYSEQRVRQECLPFEYLLAWDPITENNQVDPTFTEIHPHPYNHLLVLDAYHFKFINMAVKIYAAGKIKLSSHAVISVE